MAIVTVRLNPLEGHDLRGAARRALVLAARDFNRLGEGHGLLITRGGDFPRLAAFAIALAGTGCETQGIAPLDKMRVMNLAARKAKNVEQALKEVIDDSPGPVLTLFV